MKTICTLIILLSLTFTLGSCKKDRLAEMERSLLGSWEQREVTGGLDLGNGSPDLAPGNGRILQFTTTKCFAIIANKVVESTSYTVDVQVSGGKREYILNYENGGFPRYFKITGTRLTIYPPQGLADATTSIWERVKDPVLE